MSVHELCHAGIVFDVEQGEPGLRATQSPYDVARLLQRTSRWSSGWNQEGLRGGVVDHRFTRQPVGEIRDGSKGQALIEVEIMDELHRSIRERIVSRNLPNALADLRYCCATIVSPQPLERLASALLAIPLSFESQTIRQQLANLLTTGDELVAPLDRTSGGIAELT